MPSLRMRAWRVVRLMSRRTAAPLGPAMRHSVCFKARRMCWRSASSRVEIGEVKEVEDEEESAAGDAQLFAGRKKNGTFDEVFEFANVAWPGIVSEGIHGVGGNVFDAFVELAA